MNKSQMILLEVLHQFYSINYQTKQIMCNFHNDFESIIFYKIIFIYLMRGLSFLSKVDKFG